MLYRITVPIIGIIEKVVSASSAAEALELFHDLDHAELPIEEFDTDNSEITVEEV